MTGEQYATLRDAASVLRAHEYAPLAAVCELAEGEIGRLREALPDPAKLEMLADWFDLDDANRGRTECTEVQSDLRKWAQSARSALAAAAGEGGG